MKKYEEALKWIRKSSELDPTNDDTFELMGVCFVKIQQDNCRGIKSLQTDV